MRNRNVRSYSISLQPFTSEPVPYWNRVSVLNPNRNQRTRLVIALYFKGALHRMEWHGMDLADMGYTIHK